MGFLAAAFFNTRATLTRLLITPNRMYFQYNVERLSICPLTIHALLHIAPGIKFARPVWCYWVFPMECYCGRVQRGIHSCCFPWASMDHYVMEQAQLTQIMIVYNVFSELSLAEPHTNIPGSFSDPLSILCLIATQITCHPGQKSIKDHFCSTLDTV
ncbi:hypothetical protein K438DRAFT_991177 [Mycena galopus ATCC 62051]|nr:hypothetical protein K438DRAFT_991177 [Mycena galopus ATCC 62051]